MGNISRRGRWGNEFLIFCLCSTLSVPCIFAAGELNFSNDFGVTNNQVTGSGKNQSALTRGWTDLDQLNLYGNGKVGEFDYDFGLGSKFTNDRNIDVRNFSMTNIQGRMTNKIHTLNIGDTFESFSQYALGTPIKGGSYKFVQPKYRLLPEFTAVYGYAYSRWDSIKWPFGDPPTETQAVAREVLGTRLKENIGDNLWAALSYVRSNDSSRLTTATELYDNKAFTGDWEYKPIPGATLSGEHSYSSQRESPSAGAPDLMHHGNAQRVTAIGDADPSRVTLEYERVSPYYTTVVGAVTPDREKFKGTWRYIVNKDVTAHTGFLYFHDDLEGQLTTPRSDNYKPDAGVTLKKLFGRQYSSLDVTYKLDLQEHRGTPVNEQHFIDTNYRDRFGFLDTDTNLGWTSEKITGGGPSRQQDLTYNTTLSSRHTVDKFILKPSVYLGGWTTRDELAYVTTQIYEYSAGLGVDVPACKITSDFKVGENQLKKTAGGNTAKFFGSGNIYYRPTALAKLQGMLYVKLYVNNFSYTDASRNYRETSVSTGLNMQF